jgi:hypothetical protein
MKRNASDHCPQNATLLIIARKTQRFQSLPAKTQRFQSLPNK